MGQRANLVLVRNGEWTLHYDHWCANTMDSELLWGPDVMLRFIEQRAVQVDPVDGWLDDVWCEGGVVLDLQKRALGWFGGEDARWGLDWRAAATAILGRTWSGWSIRWLDRGIVDLARWVNVSPARVLSEKTNIHRTDSAISFAQNRMFPDDEDCLLSSLEPQGVVVWRRGGDPDILLGGPNCIEVPPTSEQRAIRWSGSPPTLGVMLDRRAKALGVWWVPDNPFVADAVSECWPGWTVTRYGSDPKPHLASLLDHGVEVKWHSTPLAEGVLQVFDHAFRLRGRVATETHGSGVTDTEVERTRAAVQKLVGELAQR